MIGVANGQSKGILIIVKLALCNDDFRACKSFLYADHRGLVDIRAEVASVSVSLKTASKSGHFLSR